MLLFNLCRYNTYFVDLFVRSSNVVAIGMYEHFGYSVYRRVLGYYTGLNPEDALGTLVICILISLNGRYAKGLTSGRQQRVNYTVEASNSTGRLRVALDSRE